MIIYKIRRRFNHSSFKLAAKKTAGFEMWFEKLFRYLTEQMRGPTLAQWGYSKSHISMKSSSQTSHTI